jgi:hypothetical protein
MRKVHLLLIGMLAMASTTMAAVPQGHSSVTLAPAAVVSTTTNNNATTAPATAALTLDDVFAPATPSAGACNLLCIQGYHCCVKGNKAQCIPNDQSCP